MSRHFLNPWFLAGLAAVAVPVLIHLLTRDRVRQVSFSTLRFFAKVSRKVLRRKRFREMVLLAMRVAVFALLALAFARPLLHGRAADAVGPGAPAEVARVVLVDVSASMARPGMPEALRAAARGALDDLAPGAGAAALITFADVPRVEVPLTARLADVASRLDALAPGDGGTDIAEALRKADALLRAAAARRKEIVLVSDLQREGWRNFKGDWRLAPDTRLLVRPVAPPVDAADFAIVEADYPASTALDGLPRTVAARVANYSAAPRQGVEVSLTVGGEKVDAQKVNVRPGESVPVRFRHVFTSPGDNAGVLRIEAADAVAADNVFYFNARVIPRIRVAIVSGPPAGPVAGVAVAGGRATDGAFFIEKALAPAPESPFLVKRVAAAQAVPQDFADVLVAILADVGDLSPQVVGALGELLARGGGLLFLPGSGTDAAAFNLTLADLAPCKLRGVLRPGSRLGDAGGAVLGRIDFEHPVFEVFQHPHYGDLSLPRFSQFWEVGDSQLAHVLARFDDGKPAVLEREIGGGLSMMFTSPVDLRWNNLPLRAVFLPLLHQAVRHLAVRSEKRTGYRVGDALPLAEGERATGPGGEAVEAPAVASAPGFYAAAGKEPRPNRRSW
ncbi:MAG: BatA domain-containing protein [Planctomycetes bacterium]|nr:BatA domain-containing protein [Planctomycetota bacterium]